jgi:hypothetical protein
MKHAKKMLVVPYVQAKIENPSERYVVNLDNEMTEILNNKNMTPDQKVKLYAQTLIKFKEKYDPQTTKQAIDIISSKVSSLIDVQTEADLGNKLSQLLKVQQEGDLGKKLTQLIDTQKEDDLGNKLLQLIDAQKEGDFGNKLTELIDIQKTSTSQTMDHLAKLINALETYKQTNIDKVKQEDVNELLTYFKNLKTSDLDKAFLDRSEYDRSYYSDANETLIRKKADQSLSDSEVITPSKKTSPTQMVNPIRPAKFILPRVEQEPLAPRAHPVQSYNERDLQKAAEKKAYEEKAQKGKGFFTNWTSF